MTLRARLLGGLSLLVMLAVASSSWLMLRLERARLHSAQAVSRVTDARNATADAKNEMYALLITVTLLDGGIVVLFVSLFLRRVTLPLEALSRDAMRVGRGEEDESLFAQESGMLEIDRLIESFRTMVATQKSAQARLVQQEKLATVGRLAAGVAHEVGNPLASIVGYTSILIGDEKPGTEHHDLLLRVQKETTRISRIIAELLDYSRPVKHSTEPVDIAAALDVALSLVRAQSRFRDVVVTRNFAADVPRVMSNQSQLEQVLVNLLLNAADAMAGAGTIQISATADSAQVVLALVDSGPGISARDRALIFDPFFTTKEPGKGTGLGLSISRSIVEAYAGTLVAEPNDTGARFVIRLPRVA